MSAVTMKVTRYGLSVKAGYWDPYGDSSTDQFQGNHGNTLNTASCALTQSAEVLLAQSLLSASDARLMRDGNGQVIPGRLKPGTLLKITWSDPHRVQYRAFDDRAPEAEPRCDLFYPWDDDRSIPDVAQVSVV